MKVIKIGGGCLKDGKSARKIMELVALKGPGHVFVVSAFGKITDLLISGVDLALENEAHIPGFMKNIVQRHHCIVDDLVDDPARIAALKDSLGAMFEKMERYYYGISFTREATPRMKDIITSFGERLSAVVISGTLSGMGSCSEYIMPHEAGILTDGKFMDATAAMKPTAQNLYPLIHSMMTSDKILVIPGFFGRSKEGEITTFGRGGSDYAAAVVAAAIRADVLEIWKDTEGFMTADPDNIPHCRLIPRLTYEEAAELAYTGAGILHPRTVEPIRTSGIGIAIKNTYNPEAPGSLITADAVTTDKVVKSVSYTLDVSILKIYASGVGARYGILSQITGALADGGINIRSVVTSQTCISLLLARNDLAVSFDLLRKIKPRPYRKLQKITDMALVSIVGDGLQRSRGIAARCFSAVSGAKVNIEMISFGASAAALYFLVKERALDKTVKALHAAFFE